MTYLITRNVRARNLLPILFISLLFFTSNSYATHVKGGDINVQYEGNYQYRINLNLYVDCSGVLGSLAQPQTVNLNGSCGTNITTTLPYQSSTFPANFCPSVQSNSTCNGGTIPGIEVRSYSTLVTINSYCNWDASWALCCRASSVNLSNQSNLRIETSFISNENSTPVWTGYPSNPNFCLWLYEEYYSSAVDPEGDSLVFSFTAPKVTSSLTVNYASGYSGTFPFGPSGYNWINSTNGYMVIHPTTAGGYWVGVKVEEYSPNGSLKSTSIRDMYFTASTCSSPYPSSISYIPNGITNFSSSGATQVDQNTIAGCPGENVCFDVAFHDSLNTDTLTLTSNIASVIPGATFSYTGTNPAVAHICFTIPNNGSNWEHFQIYSRDQFCPDPGINQYTIDLQIDSTVYAGPDVNVCPGGSVQLNTNLSSGITWSVLSGPPMVVGANFSCNNCPDPVATPSATTTYLVSGNPGWCNTTDTVTVSVVQPPSVTINSNSYSMCFPDTLYLSASVSPAQNMSYSWSPASNFLNPTAATSGVSFSNPGNYTVYLTATDSNGCVVEDSTVITVHAPPVTAISGDTTICMGDSVQVWASGGVSYSWNNFNFFNDPTLSNPLVSPPLNQWIGVIITDSNGCTGHEYMYITVHPMPNFNLGADTTICLGNSVQLSVNAGASYQWSPAGGLNDPTVGNPIATPTVTTTYSVVVTDSSGCSKSDSITITVDSNSFVSGVINQSGGSALANTTVYLIKYFPGNDSIAAIDSTITDSQGFYLFSTGEPVVYVKAAPDSLTYPNELPTYFDTSAVFQTADSIVVIPCDSNTSNFSTTGGSNPGGPGFLGGIVSQGAGKDEGVGDPIPNLNLVLVDQNGTELQHTVTDQNGHFLFSGLNYGSYTVWVDKPGVDNALGPVIAVADNRNTDDLLFSLHSFYLEVLPPVGVEELIPSIIEQVTVAPNPNKGQFLLTLTTASDVDQVRLTVMDILGHQWEYQTIDMESRNLSKQVNLQDLPVGVYFLQIQADHEKITKRLVITK